MKVIKKIQAIKYCVVLTIFLVVVDQITKTIAQYTNCSVQLIAGFGLKYVENKGLAFGLLSKTGYGSFIGLIGMSPIFWVICGILLAINLSFPFLAPISLGIATTYLIGYPFLFPFIFIFGMIWGENN